MIVNRETGQHVLWQSIFDYSKRKHCSQEKEDDECFNQVKPLDVVPEGAIEIGAHPPAFSGIIACAIKLFVDSPEQVERFAIVFNLLCSWLICVLVYLITSSIGLNKKYSLLATAVLVFASPWTIYSRSLFTENINGLFIMLAFWAVIEKRSLMAGILISIAMMIKPVFVVVGWGWICFFALDKDFRNALRLTITVGILGIVMCGFNYWKTGTVLFPGTLGWAWIDSIEGLYNNLISIDHGLFTFVPWSVVVLWIIVRKIRNGWVKGDEVFRIIMFPAILYYLLLVLYRHAAGGGCCYSCRYWVPFLPLFAIAVTKYLCECRTIIIKRLIAISLAAGVFISIPGALYYRYIWDEPFYTATKYLYKFATLPNLKKTLDYEVENVAFVRYAGDMPFSTGENMSADPKIRTGIVSKHDNGHLVFGPYKRLPQGKYKAFFSISGQSGLQNKDERVARIEVYNYDQDNISSNKWITSGDLKKNTGYYEYNLMFYQAGDDRMEFRVYFCDKEDVYVRKIYAIRLKEG